MSNDLEGGRQCAKQGLTLKLINGFVPPSIPDAGEAVPRIRGEASSTTVTDPKVEVGALLKFEGAFGKLITEWPLPSREAHAKETKGDLD